MDQMYNYVEEQKARIKFQDMLRDRHLDIVGSLGSSKIIDESIYSSIRKSLPMLIRLNEILMEKKVKLGYFHLDVEYQSALKTYLEKSIDSLSRYILILDNWRGKEDIISTLNGLYQTIETETSKILSVLETRKHMRNAA